ncbi:MAG: biotin/lipoyl-containing protein [Candidatus Auribacterota bacterium]
MRVLQKIEAPQETASEEFVTITSVPCKTGDFIKKGDTVLEIETSKATYTIEAETDGYVEYFCKEGDDIPVNSLLANIYDCFDQPSAASEAPVNKTQPDTDGLDDIVFSKSALELIERERLDKRLFKGFDFVTVDDVQDILKKSNA